MSALHLSDHELVSLSRDGDNTAFAELWTRYGPGVARFCRQYLRSPLRDPATDEHDLTAETFVRALSRLDYYEHRVGSEFRSWLLEVAKNVCLNHLEKQRRRHRWWSDESDIESTAVAAGLSVEQLMEDREALRRVEDELNKLSNDYRAAFQLFLHDYSHSDIGRALGISAAAAAKRVQRARMRLQQRLGDYFALEPAQGPMANRECLNLLAGIAERNHQTLTGKYRVITLTLPTGGDMQLCLRVSPGLNLPECEVHRQMQRGLSGKLSTRQRVRIAELCYHSGRWDRAELEYRRVIEEDPTAIPARLRLGEILTLQMNQAGAAIVYRETLEQELAPALRASVQGLLQSAQGENALAAAFFREAIRLAPRDKKNYRRLHFALGELSQYEAQLENLLTLRQIDPDDIFAHTAVYTPCARLRRFDSAKPLLERAAALDPGNPLAVKPLFQARANLMLFDEETLELAQRLVSLNPDLAESWSQLSWAYAEIGREEQSIEVLLHFLEDHPRSADALAALSWRYHYFERQEEAVDAARRAYSLLPDKHTSWTMIQMCRFPMLVTGDETQECASRIEREFPADAFLLTQVSATFMVREDLSRALDYALKAVAANPGYADALGQLGHVYRGMGNAEKMDEAFERALALPDGPSLQWLIGRAWSLRQLNDPRSAELFAAAEAAAALTSPLALATVYHTWGRYAEAIAAFEQALADPTMPPSRRIPIRRELERARLNTPPRGLS